MNTAVAAANFYSGRQGPLWDDDRISLPTAPVHAGTLARPVPVTIGGDCLVLSHAVVSSETTG